MPTRLVNCTALFLAIALTASVAWSADSSWPQWRGPNRDGQFTGPAWPKKLDTNHLQRTWRVELGPSYSGPIDGVAYNHLKSQRVMAIEVESGRELWTSDKSFGKYLSLVAQGDRILALDQRGQLFQFRANKEKFEQLDQRKLTDSETWAHLAVAGDQLFVRELNALTAFRWQKPEHSVTQAFK